MLYELGFDGMTHHSRHFVHILICDTRCIVCKVDNYVRCVAPLQLALGDDEFKIEKASCRERV